MDTNKDKKTNNFIADQKNHDEFEKDLLGFDILNDSLKKPSEKGFSLGFSTHIIRKIEVKQQRQFNLKIYSLLAVILLMSLVLLITLFNEDQLSMMFSLFFKYKFIILFTLIAVSLVQIGSRSFILKEEKD
ncbi:hypothetical protein [Chryseobacterium polytrichastri]|uniref:Uncharacterized protein n=1 Tax=Chryseobacterium polytrichastri TaxID=1302687 RepID=A0A1M6ZUA8_9FLAO|nr:hypothetical protein [Chryseobacterium polytrichastri]SHL34071.1 hypothetical protein SAMN05444267_101641 [Chryseobacterium polytrichastri]